MLDRSDFSYSFASLSINKYIQYAITFFSWFTPVRLLLMFLLLQPIMEFTAVTELNIARHIAWRLLILFLFVFTIYDSILTKNIISLPKFIRYPLVFYIFTIFVSTILAYSKSYIDALPVVYALSTLILLLIFIYVIPYWFISIDSVYLVLKIYIHSLVITNLYGIVDFLLNRFFFNDIFFRMSSFFNDPNIFARFNLIGIFFIISILFFSKKFGKNIQIYYIFALILSGFSILMSLSRSGYLTLFIGLFIFSFLFKGKKYKIIAFVTVFLIGLIGTFLLATQRDFFGGTAIVEASSLNRLQLILGGIEIIQNNWLFGIGYSNFGNYYVATYVSDILRISAFNYFMLGYATSIHNWLIEVWAEQGIFGVIAFVFLFGSLIKYLFKNFKEASNSRIKVCLSSFLLMIFIFLIQGFFYYTFIFHFFFWLMFGFTISLILILEKSKLIKKNII